MAEMGDSLCRNPVRPALDFEAEYTGQLPPAETSLKSFQMAAVNLTERCLGVPQEELSDISIPSLKKEKKKQAASIVCL